MVTRIVDGNNANRLMLLEAEDGGELLTVTRSDQGVVFPSIRGRGNVSVGATQRRNSRATHEIHQYLKNVIRRAKGGRVATLGATPIAFRCDHGMQDFFTSYFFLQCQFYC